MTMEKICAESVKNTVKESVKKIGKGIKISKETSDYRRGRVSEATEEKSLCRPWNRILGTGLGRGRRACALLLTAALAASMFTGCGQKDSAGEQQELIILAAASLTDVCDNIKAAYEAKHPNVTLTFSFGGSGALQSQIQEGAPADVFISAATAQMTALDEQGLMDSASIVQLLENKVVLILPADSSAEIVSFDDVATDKVALIGLGEPGSVPAGQYAEEIFTSLGTLDAVKAKANYGSDVRTVLSWVETGAVDCGVVYATDAYTSDQVKIVCEAPEGFCKQVIYPAGIVKSSEHAEAAASFLEYLQREECAALFETYGFTPLS